jgi:hypothetical protein
MLSSIVKMKYQELIKFSILKKFSLINELSFFTLSWLRWPSCWCQISIDEGLLVEIIEMDGDTISNGTQINRYDW